MPMIIYGMTARYNLHPYVENLGEIFYNLPNMAIYGKNMFLTLARSFSIIFAPNFGCV
jgi:hypothetical protein